MVGSLCLGCVAFPSLSHNVSYLARGIPVSLQSTQSCECLGWRNVRVRGRLRPSIVSTSHGLQKNSLHLLPNACRKIGTLRSTSMNVGPASDALVKESSGCKSTHRMATDYFGGQNGSLKPLTGGLFRNAGDSSENQSCEGRASAIGPENQSQTPDVLPHGLLACRDAIDRATTSTKRIRGPCLARGTLGRRCD